MLSSRSKRRELCTRGLLCFLSLASVIWSAATLPAFWSIMPAKETVARLLAEDRFKSEALGEILARMPSDSKAVFPRTDRQRAEALIRHRILEGRVGSGDVTEDRHLRAALTSNPGDSYLWLVLYSVDTIHAGFDSRTVRYLEQSYLAGPLEGWIALRRSRLALATFAALDPLGQHHVEVEFAHMVDSDFAEEAAITLRSVGWEQRDRLLASLEDIGVIPREAFAKVLARDGVKATVPGVVLDERVWRW